MNGADRAARLLLACADRLVPEASRGWFDAMRAEISYVDGAEMRLRWAAGCLVAALKLLAASDAARFHGRCGLFVVLITAFDWRSADPTATIAMLALVPALLAFRDPDRRWWIGSLFGMWMLAVHIAASPWPALRPHYQALPLSLAEIAEIALLLAVTLPAAAVGGWIGSGAARPR